MVGVSQLHSSTACGWEPFFKWSRYEGADLLGEGFQICGLAHINIQKKVRDREYCPPTKSSLDHVPDAVFNISWEFYKPCTSVFSIIIFAPEPCSSRTDFENTFQPAVDWIVDWTISFLSFTWSHRSWHESLCFTFRWPDPMDPLNVSWNCPCLRRSLAFVSDNSPPLGRNEQRYQKWNEYHWAMDRKKKRKRNAWDSNNGFEGQKKLFQNKTARL